MKQQIGPVIKLSISIGVRIITKYAYIFSIRLPGAVPQPLIIPCFRLIHLNGIFLIHFMLGTDCSAGHTHFTRTNFLLPPRILRQFFGWFWWGTPERRVKCEQAPELGPPSGQRKFIKSFFLSPPGCDSVTCKIYWLNPDQISSDQMDNIKD